MKDIYIVQSFSGTVPAKLIRVVTKYDYSHIALSLDQSLSKMYSFGRREVNQPLNSGFILENIESDFYKKFKNSDCRVLKVTISNRQYSKLTKLLNKYESNPDKYDYDILGLILKAFRIDIKRKDHYTCSQFVAEVIKESYIFDFNKPPERIRPKDFESLPYEIVYTGKVTDYLNLI